MPRYFLHAPNQTILIFCQQTAACNSTWTPEICIRKKEHFGVYEMTSDTQESNAKSDDYIRQNQNKKRRLKPEQVYRLVDSYRYSEVQADS
jgi:hypothetical protein